MKTSVSVRKGLEPLARWVAWVYDRSAPVPDHPEACMPEERQREVRELTRRILEKVADAHALRLKTAAKGKIAPTTEIELPPLRTRIFVDEIFRVWSDWDPYRDGLMPALQNEIAGFGRNSPAIKTGNRVMFPVRWHIGAWTRLRRCNGTDCRRVFVALVPRAIYCRRCSNRLRQAEFYKNHTARERNRKLKQYHVNRMKMDAAKSAAAAARSCSDGSEH